MVSIAVFARSRRRDPGITANNVLYDHEISGGKRSVNTSGSVRDDKLLGIQRLGEIDRRSSLLKRKALIMMKASGKGNHIAVIDGAKNEFSIMPGYRGSGHRWKVRVGDKQRRGYFVGKR